MLCRIAKSAYAGPMNSKLMNSETSPYIPPAPSIEGFKSNLNHDPDGQTTLVLIKPDGVRRGLVGEIIGRIERKGLKLAALRMVQMDETLARRHYRAHTDKSFFPGLLAFITSGPVVALAVQGKDAVAAVRSLMGATDPAQAAPGTVRGDFGLEVTENLVHGSDGVDSATYELSLFFPDLVPEVKV